MYKLYKFIVHSIFFGLLISFSGSYAEDTITLKDPTQPSTATTSSKTIPTNVVPTTNNISEIKVDAIFVGKNNKYVIIGDRTFTVGDKIQDATIIEINSHAVKFKMDDGEIKIATPSTDIKSPIRKEKKDREN